MARIPEFRTCGQVVSTHLRQCDESSKTGKEWCLPWPHGEEFDCRVWLKEGQEGFSEEVTFDPRQAFGGGGFQVGRRAHAKACGLRV